jgi:hypothetical protein
MSDDESAPSKGLALTAFEKAREHFEETNNILYAVIAIGKAGQGRVPDWAIAACRDYAQAVADAAPMELRHFGTNVRDVRSTENFKTYKRVLARIKEMQTIPELKTPEQHKAAASPDWRASLYSACKELDLSDSARRTVERYFELDLRKVSELADDELDPAALTASNPKTKAGKMLRKEDQAARNQRTENQLVMRSRKPKP